MCHAVGRFGDSPLPIAPPFRDLHEVHPIDEPEASLREGVFFANHPNMPQFTLEPDQIADVIAYLKSPED
jgi:mono/diheme cytochrome c family protein